MAAKVTYQAWFWKAKSGWVWISTHRTLAQAKARAIYVAEGMATKTRVVSYSPTGSKKIVTQYNSKGLVMKPPKSGFKWD